MRGPGSYSGAAWLVAEGQLAEGVHFPMRAHVFPAVRRCCVRHIHHNVVLLLVVARLVREPELDVGRQDTAAVGADELVFGVDVGDAQPDKFSGVNGGRQGALVLTPRSGARLGGRRAQRRGSPLVCS